MKNIIFLFMIFIVMSCNYDNKEFAMNDKTKTVLTNTSEKKNDLEIKLGLNSIDDYGNIKLTTEFINNTENQMNIIITSYNLNDNTIILVDPLYLYVIDNEGNEEILNDGFTETIPVSFPYYVSKNCKNEKLIKLYIPYYDKKNKYKLYLKYKNNKKYWQDDWGQYHMLFTGEYKSNEIEVEIK